MATCQNCGKQVADGAPYCLSCGAQQQAAPVQPSYQQQPVQPAVQQQPAPVQPVVQQPLAAPAQPALQQQPYAAPAQPAGAPPVAQKKGGMPGWAIALIVIAVVAAIVAGVLVIVLPFYFVGNVVKDVVPTITNVQQQAYESATRSGVRNIQVGLETWAVDHDGKYPLEKRVTAEGLSTVTSGGYAYIDPWPDNPYDGGPMTQGTGPGQFTYVRGAGGTSFTLTGYGENGTILITLP